MSLRVLDGNEAGMAPAFHIDQAGVAVGVQLPFHGQLPFYGLIDERVGVHEAMLGPAPPTGEGALAHVHAPASGSEPP